MVAIYEDERKLIRMGPVGYYVTQCLFYPVAALNAERAMIELLNGLTDKQKRLERQFDARDYVQAHSSVPELRFQYTDEICFPDTGF